ncbi:MAG: FAD-dependent oxidoreductase [Burkholderiaceae bacterium]|nr:FAD-dependent oxidoreductase [Burkholderiaceae bacterium]
MQRVLGKENGLTKSPKDKPIVVIGGGIGGLVSALEMASAGLQVILVEKEQKLGGKIRQIDCGGKGALWLFVSKLASYIAPLRNPTCSPLVHP